jgi:hypothetical protein
VTRRLTCFAILIVLSVPFAVGQHQFQRGLNWEDNRYNGLPVKYASQVTLPASMSLKQFYPRVITQPKQDFTAVAWACAWNARTASEAIACNIQGATNVLQVAFSPGFNYGLVRKGKDCREAVGMIDLLESMVKNGTPYWSEYREFCVAEVSTEAYSAAKGKRLSGYVKLFNTSDAQDVKVSSIKQALISHNPVVVGIICPPSFQLAQEFWHPSELPDTEYGGHVVNIVGYDDTKYGGAVEVLNTWGKDWATEGYTWVRYKDLADFTRYGFSLFQVGSAACSSPVDAEVSFRDVGGKEMPVTRLQAPGEYMLTQSYPSGTMFSIVLTTSRPAYVYSFGVDPTNAFFPLFPRAAFTMPISFGPLKAPDDMPVLQLTDPPGRNVIYVVISPGPVDLSNCINLLKKEVDFPPRKVESVLSAGPRPVTSWQPSKVGFNSSLSGPVAIKVVLNQK